MRYKIVKKSYLGTVLILQKKPYGKPWYCKHKFTLNAAVYKYVLLFKLNKKKVKHLYSYVIRSSQSHT